MAEVVDTDKIESLGRIPKREKEALSRLQILTIRDLLMRVPVRYVDSAIAFTPEDITQNEIYTLYGVIQNAKTTRSFKGHVPMTKCKLDTGIMKLDLIFFHQAYISKMYPDGSQVRVIGKIENKAGALQILNPKIEKINKLPIPSHSLFASKIVSDNSSENTDIGAVDEGSHNKFLIPIYRESFGISSNYIHNLIKKVIALNIHSKIPDILSSEIRSNLSLPSIKDAILYLHFPTSEGLALAAKKRMAFEEIYTMQIIREREKAATQNELSFKITDDKYVEEFLGKVNLSPTNAQIKAIKSILADIAKPSPMSRLLEGDVGSGKTLVAAAIMWTVTRNRSADHTPLQVAYMAPTEILAQQQFESVCKYYKGTNMEVGLITSKGCFKFPSKINNELAAKVSRSQFLKWLEDGKLSVVFGTSSLVSDKVVFKNLALTIIDEQHRFGVKQRKKLAQKRNSKAQVPHLLTMTATPIPRTLALTIFGDLDLTVIDEMPKGRLPIITKFVAGESGREKIFEHILSEAKANHQVYIISPRIETSEDESKSSESSVELEYKRYAEKFKHLSVQIVHGKSKDKDQVMKDFKDGKIDILISTQVIEVGVNVPNATVLVIEGADRFGLASLHQLRGRVGRSDMQSYCYVLSNTQNEESIKRLQKFASTNNGFELAESDLEVRGAGALIGGKQWGMSDIAMEAIRNRKLVEIAKEFAVKTVSSDPELQAHPDLLQKIEGLEKVHLE